MAATLSKEDVVRRKHRGQIQLGLVTYSYTGDSSSEDDDDDDSDVVRKGEVRVSWYPKGRVEVLAEDKVTLHDRSLLPGDIVRYSVGDQPQKGLVKTIHVNCHLQVLNTRQMVYNIPSQQLTPIERFQPSDHVVLDDWVGIVRDNYNSIVTAFKNGARCVLSDEDACRLIDIHDNSDEDSVFGEEVGFFPGQTLRGPSSVFKGAKWLSGPRPILSSKIKFRVIVEEVKIVGVDVQWCTRAVSKNASDLKPPPSVIKGKNLERLKLLNFSAHASVQIGDKCMYTLDESDLTHPESVSKGGALCFRRPDEAATFDALSVPEEGDADMEVSQSDPGLVLQRLIRKYKTVTAGGGARTVSPLLSSLLRLLMPKECGPGSDGRTGGDGVGDDGVSEMPRLQDVSSSELQSILTEVVKSDQEHTHVSDTVDQKTFDGLESKDEEKTDAQSQRIFGGQTTTNPSASHDCTAMEDQTSDDGMKSECGASGGESEKCSNFSINDKHLHDLQSCLSSYMSNSSLFGDLASTATSDKPLLNGDAEPDGDKSSRLAAPQDSDASALQTLYKELQELSQDVDKLRSPTAAESKSDSRVTRKLLVQMLRMMYGKLSGQSQGSRDSIPSPRPARSKVSYKRRGEQTVGKGSARSERGGSKRSCMTNKSDSSANETDDDESDDEEKAKSDTSDDEEEDVLADDTCDQDEEKEKEGEEEEAEGGIDGVKPSAPKMSSHGAARRPKPAAHLQKKRRDPSNVGPLKAGQSVCVEVTHTFTKVDVLWQDGTYEKGIISTDVIPCRQLDELEFFPGDFVTQGKGTTGHVYGVVTRTNNKERTCDVNWVSRQGDPTSELDIKTEELSVYELTPHPDFVFSVDDVVVRIAHNVGEDDRDGSLPPAGQVQEVNSDGSISVRWVDDTRSKVMPHLLYRVEEDFDSEISFTDDKEEDCKERLLEVGVSCDGTSSDSSWETASEDSGSGEDGPDSDKEDISAEEDPDGGDEESAARSKTEPHDDKAERTGEVETRDQTEEPISTASDCSVLQQSITEVSEKRSLSQTSPSEGVQKEGSEDVKPKTLDKDGLRKVDGLKVGELHAKEGEGEGETAEDGDLQSPNAASRFIMEGSLPSTHYFSTALQPTNRKQFLQIWKKEVRLLQTALPQGILVKAFEDRMDMFSAMIEGPANTPYEDGLFFFDIRLLGDYPHSPPKVHYLSYCSGRLNPNLYNDGKVCLSLLGTWTGKGNEMWTASSNLLQLLVSVQGLILVNEPYYNEAGYEKHRGTMESLENCRMYNEMVLVKMVQCMTNILNSPPELFKEETVRFCKKRCVRLLKRLESWLEGASKQTNHPDSEGQSSRLIKTETSLAAGSPCPADLPIQEGRTDQPDSIPTSVSGSDQGPPPATKLTSQPPSDSASSSPAETPSICPSSPNDAAPSLANPVNANSQPVYTGKAPDGPGDGDTTQSSPAPFILFPLSKGFIISINHALEEFRVALTKAGIS